MTFEGTTEMGNPFMARQSYLPSEIRWGYQFVRCIHRPHGTATRYIVDIAKCAVTGLHHGAGHYYVSGVCMLRM